MSNLSFHANIVAQEKSERIDFVDKQRQLEQKRVDAVIDEIKKQQATTQVEYEKAHQETSSVERNYVQNARINTLEVDDQMETNAEVQQQKNLVAKTLENENILKKQLDTLKILNDSPYFGRIDIQDPDETEPETLYIGTASLVDDNHDFLIYDWRAPISSIYYNGALGKVSYQTPMGNEETELLKKRQFTIENGKIINMFDTNETVGDEILQNVLGEHSDEYMRNIVATIQKEQNDIIRDTKHDLLLVQGVAGSGKTSAILQRIAFLLYHSRDKLEADQIVLFSPNLLFSHYISEVLPSLGERNMRQVTLAEFLKNRLEGLNVENLFMRYEQENSLSVEKKKIRQQKESPRYMQQITDYVDNLSNNAVQFRSIYLNGSEFFNNSQINDIYNSLPQLMKPAQKFAETKNKLIKLLNQKIKREALSEWVLERIENLSDEQYYDILGNKRRGSFQSLEDEQFYIGRKIVHKEWANVYDGIYNDYFIDTYAQYRDFLKHNYPQALDDFDSNLELHKMALEDCAPLLYLRDRLTGSGINHGIAHLFIDEMQDYSLPQLIYLHYIFPEAKFTLLGDSEQALFNEFRTPDELLAYYERHLDFKRANIIKLNKSYRSTQQITDFMKSLLPDGNEIISFTRTGPLPEIIQSVTDKQALQNLKLKLRSYHEEKRVAIITRNKQEASELYRLLKREFNPTLLNDTSRSLPLGVIILPIYLAKGLEFDNVIAFGISTENYSGARAIGILYTICSRAMHHLTLITCGQLPELLQEVDPQLYQQSTLLSVK